MDDNNPVNGSTDEELNKELEELKDTFQKTYDETAEQNADFPIIQELEPETDAPDEEEEDDDDEKEPEAIEDTIGVLKVKEKKPKKKKKGALIALISVLVLLVLMLGAYFAVTVIEPDFLDFATAYTTATQADSATEAITAYETALDYCTEDSKLLYGMRQEILEAIVLKTNEANGYAAAASYMNENLTEEMIASPKSAQMKAFIEAGKNIDDIADKALDAVTDALNGATTADGFDADAIMAQLGVSDIIKTAATEAFTTLAKGVALENGAQSKQDVQDAITTYFNAYSQFTSLSANGQKLLESIVSKMYHHGYAYEAKLIYDNYFTEDMTAAYKTEGFGDMLDEINTIGTYEGDVYALAKQQFEAGAYTANDFITALDVDIPENALKALAEICVTVAEGLKAEQDGNLTLASTDLQTALDALGTFELKATELAAKTAYIVFLSGDSQTANTVVGTYLTDDVLATVDADVQAQVSDIKAYYNAQYAANEVFYPYYYNAYYQGSDLNKDEINDALDAVITADSTEIDKAFVTYYKYLTEAFTDNDQQTLLDLLLKFKSQVSDKYPMTYGYSLAEVYVAMGEYDKALEIANEILAVNIADDYAISLKALGQRINKDVEGALATAKEGIELSGTDNYCAHELVIDSMLTGDWLTAFEYAQTLYTGNLTVDNCELVLVINALNDIEDADKKAEISALAKEVEDTFSSYGVTISDNAQALIDKTKTLEDVFLDGTFNFN